MMQSPIEIAIYTRVSTEDQATEGYSLQAQREILERYAKERGYKIYGVYSDEGYSAKDYNRPQVQRMFSHLKEGRFQAVLIKSVDRISRRMSDLGKLIDDVIHPNNCHLLISDNNLDSRDPNGMMMINLLGNFAQFERSAITERVKVGMKKRAELGLWNGGIILGYDNVNKQLIINEQEARIIKKIFSLRVEGKGYKFIATILNKEGYRTKKGRLFSIPTIKIILENPTYIGKCRWGKHKDWTKSRRGGKSEDYVLVDGKHKAIITMETWNKVQAVEKISKDSLASQRSYKGTFVLTGLLRCPQCGAGTCMAKRKKRDESGYHLYYKCMAYQSKGIIACRTNLIQKEVIENQVLERIAHIINNNTVVSDVLDKIQSKRIEKQEGLEAALNTSLVSLNKKKTHLDKLSQDYFNGVISPATYDSLALGLRSQIRELEEQVEKLSISKDDFDKNEPLGKEEVIRNLQDFQSLYNRATFEQKKQLLKAIIRKVEVESDRKTLKQISFWFEEYRERRGCYVENSF